MQDANKVVKVLSRIADCDFSVGLYTHINGPEDKIVWIGSASHGFYCRYFTIMGADTERPIICLINRSESLKPIDKVVPTMSNVHFAIYDFVRDGFLGIVRNLGFYRFLAQYKKLALSDFKPLGPCTQSNDRFSAYNFYADSLEKANILPVFSFGDNETAAHQAAKEWNDIDGNYLGVVVSNRQGVVVAVYYKGNRIC
jgi:hypothetical protein